MLTLALLLGLAGCVAYQGPTYRAENLIGVDEVTFTVTGRDAVVDIRSETGIGSATIEQIAGAPHASLVLRFHLAGLEELRFAFGDAVVTAHVSSINADVREELMLAGGPAQAIGADSPYWLAVRLPGDGRIPATGGPIEVTAPRAFLALETLEARSISLRWIDFYR